MMARFLILFLSSLILSGCFSNASSASESGKALQPVPTVEISNSNNLEKPQYIDYQHDQSLIDKLNEENDKFRQAPDEFKTVDFKNFKYNFGRLKNGEYERFNPARPTEGAEQYIFHDVFYVDLMGDAKREAIVLLNALACGGSCDGGRDLIYFYFSNKGKTTLIDILETGSNSSGCSLKSFAVKDKKLYVEQFGRCEKNTDFELGDEFVCKFCTKDETQSVYSITKNGLKRESFEIIETETINVMNSPAYFRISE